MRNFIKVSALCLMACTLPNEAKANSLQHLENLATQRAIASERVLTKHQYNERIRGNHLPTSLWEELALRPQAFMQHNPNRASYASSSIPPNARWIDPKAKPTPFPSQKRNTQNPAQTQRPTQSPTQAKVQPPTQANQPRATMQTPSPQVPLVPTTPPIPKPGPRNPLDQRTSNNNVATNQSLATSPTVDPEWQWPDN